MKKLILASAIAAIAANSATAATIYEDKGLTFKMKGDWQIQLRDDYKKSSGADVEFDDLEIKNTVIYDLGNDLKAFGQVDFGFKDAVEGKQSGSDLEEAYIGLQYSNVKVKVGKMDLASYEFGIEGAYETTLEEDQFDAISTSGDDVIRVEADFDIANVIFSHEINSEGNDSADGEATDLFVGGDFGPVAVAAAFQTFQADTANAKNIDTWGLSAEFDAGVATIGADYSVSDDSNTNQDTAVANLVATFKATDTTKLALGYVNLDSDDNSKDADTWYANVSYKFPSQKNVKLFAEVSSTNYDDAATDATVETDVLAGMQIKF
jgi:predicted porin